MAKLTPNNTYEAILAGEAVTPTSRDQAFIKEAVDNAGSGGGGGGADLPEVTSDDNGDVLTVVEGEWAKADPSGGKFVVTLSHVLESVASLSLGEGQAYPDYDGFYHWAGSLTAEQYGNFDGSKSLYFNSKEYPLTTISEEQFGYNLEFNDFKPTPSNPNEPCYYIVAEHESEVYGYQILSTDTSLANTTVNILAAGEGYTADKTVTEVYAAYEAGQIVNCIIDLGEVYELQLVNAGDEVIGFASDAGGGTVAARGVNDHGDDSWDVQIYQYQPRVENLKPTYEFGFTATPDGQGRFTVTPDSGSTYAAITAALAETPNVYAKIEIENLSLTLLFNNKITDSVSYVDAVGLGDDTYFRLSVADDGGNHFTANTLQFTT